MPTDRQQLASDSSLAPKRTRFIFGDRWQFAIECEVEEHERDPWGSLEPFGSFWLWVEGRVIGNSDVQEQLAIAFVSVREMVRFDGTRPDSRFEALTALQKLELVIWATFGEDEEFDEDHWGSNPEEIRQEGLRKYELVWRGYSPFSDGWEAILTEQDATETIVWRSWNNSAVMEVREASVRRGICRETGELALGWFDRYRRDRMGAELKEHSDGSVRLVRRIEH
jgi:hypothetical protein